jgi:hypothetical protein
MLQADIQIGAGLLGEEVDFHGGGNRHVAPGGIKIGHMKNTGGPPVGDDPSNQLLASSRRGLTDEGRNVDAVLTTEREYDLVGGGLLDPNFEVIARAKCRLINQLGSWQGIRRRAVVLAEFKLRNLAVVDLDFRVDIVFAVEIDDRLRITAINNHAFGYQVEVAGVADCITQFVKALGGVDIGRAIHLRDRRLLRNQFVVDQADMNG